MTRDRRVLHPTGIVIAVLGLTVGLVIGRITAPHTAAQTVVTTVVAAPDTPTSSPRSGSAVEPTGEGGDPDAADASPAATPYAQTAAGRREWEQVVLGFAKSYPQTGTGQQTWAARLAPYSTASVQQQLATIDLANVPTGTYTGYQALSYDEEQVTVKVDYQPGWALALSLIHDGQTWRVFQLDRHED